MIKNKIIVSGLMVIFWLVTNISFAKVNDLPPVTNNNAIPHMMINDKTMAVWWYIKNTNTWTTNTWSIQTYSFHKNNTWKNNTWMIAQKALWWSNIKKITSKSINKKIIIKSKTKITKKIIKK